MQLKKLSMKKPNKIVQILTIAVVILYPFLIFFALQHNFSLNILAFLMLIAFATSFLRSRKKLILLIGLFLVTTLLFTNNILFLKLYPICMNIFVCLTFGLSLKGKALLTIFAEKMGKKLTKEVEIYTRKATCAWTIFMALNTFISIITLFLPTIYWTIYNGCLSYMLIGLMFLGEYLVRRRTFHDA